MVGRAHWSPTQLNCRDDRFGTCGCAKGHVGGRNARRIREHGSRRWSNRGPAAAGDDMAGLRAHHRIPSFPWLFEARPVGRLTMAPKGQAGEVMRTVVHSTVSVNPGLVEVLET